MRGAGWAAAVALVAWSGAGAAGDYEWSGWTATGHAVGQDGQPLDMTVVWSGWECQRFTVTLGDAAPHTFPGGIGGQFLFGNYVPFQVGVLSGSSYNPTTAFRFRGASVDGGLGTEIIAGNYGALTFAAAVALAPAADC